MWKIAIDAMGGDSAPKAIIEGTLSALKKNSDIEVILLGIEDKIKEFLPTIPERVSIIDKPEVIETGEDPLVAIRKKKNSSLIAGLEMLKKKEADAFISAGSTGAVMSGAYFKTGRIKGVARPALSPVMPTKTGKAILIDCGANADCTPEFMIQFAQMGSAYMELVEGVKNPRVGLVNIGAEEEKGNKLYKQVHQDLKGVQGINFVGNIEARDCLLGEADVLVCDGFTGNILLKTLEGMASYLFAQIKEQIVKSFVRKMAFLVLKKGFKAVKSSLDYKEYGGAPLLGINGCVIKAHGSSDADSFAAAIIQGIKYLDQGVTESIKSAVEK